jgi:uncharacterized membrane protein YdjX (TVP38/TMEM64 family)
MKSFFGRLLKTLGVWRLLGVPVLALAVLGAAIWSEETILRLHEFFVAVEGSGAIGKIVFILVYALVCLVSVLPASMMALAAGAMYGLLEGFTLSAVALFTGAGFAFALSRYLFRSTLESWISNKLALSKLDAALAGGGWRVVGLFRLSPVAPFGVTSYAFGLTKVSFGQYLLGSVGVFPSLLLYVYSGTVAEKVITGSSLRGTSEVWLQWVVMITGFMATLLAVLYLVRIARTSVSVPDLEDDRKATIGE